MTRPKTNLSTTFECALRECVERHGLVTIIEFDCELLESTLQSIFRNQFLF